MRLLLTLIVFLYSTSLFAHDENELNNKASGNPPNLSQTLSGNLFFNDSTMKDNDHDEKVNFLVAQFDNSYDDPTKTPASNKISRYYPALGKYKNYNIEVNLDFYKLINAGALNIYYMEAKPGAVTPVHYHKDYQLAVYVLEGITLAYWGDKLQNLTVAKAGDTLYVPAGVCHQVINPSKTMVSKLIEIRTHGDNDVRVPCAENIGFPKANLYTEN